MAVPTTCFAVQPPGHPLEHSGSTGGPSRCQGSRSAGSRQPAVAAGMTFIIRRLFCFLRRHHALGIFLHLPPLRSASQEGIVPPSIEPDRAATEPQFASFKDQRASLDLLTPIVFFSPSSLASFQDPGPISLPPGPQSACRVARRRKLPSTCIHQSLPRRCYRRITRLSRCRSMARSCRRSSTLSASSSPFPTVPPSS